MIVVCDNAGSDLNLTFGNAGDDHLMGQEYDDTIEGGSGSDGKWRFKMRWARG